MELKSCETLKLEQSGYLVLDLSNNNIDNMIKERSNNKSSLVFLLQSLTLDLIDKFSYFTHLEIRACDMKNDRI